MPRAAEENGVTGGEVAGGGAFDGGRDSWQRSLVAARAAAVTLIRGRHMAPSTVA